MSTTKRRISKASKRRLLTAGLFSIFLFLYFCFTVVTYTYKIVSLSNQESNLKIKLNQLKTNREELLVEIEKLQDPDYLARYAREAYYYTKDGEYVIKLDKMEETTEEFGSEISRIEEVLSEIKNISSKYKYVVLTSVLLLSGSIIYVIKKSRI